MIEQEDIEHLEPDYPNPNSLSLRQMCFVNWLSTISPIVNFCKHGEVIVVNFRHHVPNYKYHMNYKEITICEMECKAKNRDKFIGLVNKVKDVFGANDWIPNKYTLADNLLYWDGFFFADMHISHAVESYDQIHFLNFLNNLVVFRMQYI